MLDAALCLAQRGLHVFPVDHPGLPKCIGLHGPNSPCDGKRGKHPAVKFSMAATTNPKMIAAWWAGATRNVGIACKPSRLVVLDEDAPGEVGRWCADHQLTLPVTYTVTTGRGKHYYFHGPGDLEIGNTERPFRGYDVNVRGYAGTGGGYVVAPGSVHATGTLYTEDDAAAPIAELPRPLAEQLARRAVAERAAPVDRTAVRDDPNTGKIGYKHRHDALVAYAGRLRKRGLDLAEAEVLYRERWLNCVQPPGLVPEARYHEPPPPDGDCNYPVTWHEALAKLRDVYDRYDAGHVDEETPLGLRTLKLTTASQIKVRPVRWLLKDRVALGTLALLGGREGIGKSTVAYTYAADLTQGRLPGEYHGQPKAVIVAATEDSWEHTIVPRLMAARADLTRVYRVDVETSDGVGTTLSLPRDLRALEDAVRQVDAAMILLDPLMSRLDGKLDTHKDAEVRLALEPLTALADRTGAAIVGLIHVNKGRSTDPLNILMGSRAFGAVARSVLFVMKDPDDETLRLLGTPKNNLGRDDLPTLTFRIESAHVADTDEGPIWTGRVYWLGEREQTIREVLEASEETADARSATDEAGAWLTDYLASKGGTDDSATVKREGAKAGHSQDALKRARRKLKIEAKPEGFPRRTFWTLPGTAPLQSEQPSGSASGESALTAPTAPTEAQSVQSEQLVQSAHSPETRSDCDCGWPLDSLGHETNCLRREAS